MSLFRFSIRSHERRPHATRLRAICVVASMIALPWSAVVARASVHHVNSSRPEATDVGPGTRDIPCRTIQGAVIAFGSAGNTILVHPGIYRETVTLAASGTTLAPIVLKAAAPGVIVTGTDDFSAPEGWVLAADGNYLAAAVSWQPLQVFIDGARLSYAPPAPAPLPLQSFRWVAGEGLYVNIGGHPGSHACEIGRRAAGIFVSGAHVVVEGFDVMRSDDRAVLVNGHHTVIRGCAIRFANKYGIDVTLAPDVTLEGNTVSDNNDHGIIVKKESARCRIANNESFRNARPGARAANGLDVDGSTDCVVENNRFHHNQDSGVQFVNGANNGLSRNNLSWANGDHGFDHVRATGIRHFHDVAYGNVRDGFSFEGMASGGAIFNSIAVNNGITSNEFNLWVDEASSEGFQSDYNIFWNATSHRPIKFRGFQLVSLAEYSAASGLDRHSRAADPRFMDPAAADFRLRAGSPAIDAASSDSAASPAVDAAARPRFDDPATVNSGTGAQNYADLGASEYRNLAPVAALGPDVSSGIAPHAIELDATGSSDPEGVSLSYRFDFGDGSPALLEAGSIAAHTYGPGTFTSALTVTDEFGASDTAHAVITVAANLCANPGMETDLRGWQAYGAATIVRIAGGRSGTSSVSVRANAAQTVGLADHPNFVANVPAAGITYRYTAWVRSAAGSGTIKLQLREYLSGMLQGTGAISPVVRLSPAWQRLAAELTTVRSGSSIEFEIKSLATAAGEEFEVDDVAIIVVSDATADKAPIVSAPVTAAGAAGERITVKISAADPDGDALTWLGADFSHLPAGSNATFAPNTTSTGGTFTWTPSASDARAGGYRVMFTAANAMNGSAATTIFVTGAEGGSNLCQNPGFETGLAGWEAYGPATIARVEGGHSGAFCAEVRATGSTTIGLGDLPNWVTVPNANAVYRYSAWVRSAAHAGTAKLVVREFMSGAQLGTTAYSSAVRLSPAWQQITAEIRTLKAGSVLEFEIKDYQAIAGEVFQIDDVTITRVNAESSGSGRVSRGDASSTEPLRFSAAISPNPLRDAGTLDFVLTRRGAVEVQLFDLHGRSAGMPLFARMMEPGRHRVAVSLARAGNPVAPGAYFYRVRADEGVLTGKVLVVR